MLHISVGHVVIGLSQHYTLVPWKCLPLFNGFVDGWGVGFSATTTVGCCLYLWHKITIYKPSQPFLSQLAGLGPGLKFTAASLWDTGAERCFYRLLLRPGCPRGCWRCTVYGNGEGCFQKSVAFVHIASFGSTASADDEQLKMRAVHVLHCTVQKGQFLNELVFARDASVEWVALP